MGRRPNGSGSFIKLKNGTWQISLRYTSKNDISKRIYGYGKSKKEAKEDLEKTIEEFEAECRMNDDRFGTLGENMEKWLQTNNQVLRRKKLQDNSFDRVVSTFETHIKNSFLGKMQEKCVTDKDIDKLLKNLHKHKSNGRIAYKKNEKGEYTDEELSLSDSSKRKVYNLLNEYFGQKYIRASELNPMLTVMPIVASEKVYNDVIDDDDEMIKSIPLESVWDDDEMEKITEFCNRTYEPGKKGSLYRGEIIIILLWTGLRLGELLALQLKDVHIEDDSIHIDVYKSLKVRKHRGKSGVEYYVGSSKTRSGKRRIMLVPYAKDALRKYLERFPVKNDTDYIFVNSDTNEILRSRSVQDAFSRVIKALEYDKINGKNTTVHGLRHSFASYLIRKKIDLMRVSSLMGHSSVSITERVYIEVIREYTDKAIIDITNIITNKKEKN